MRLGLVLILNIHCTNAGKNLFSKTSNVVQNIIPNKNVTLKKKFNNMEVFFCFGLVLKRTYRNSIQYIEKNVHKEIVKKDFIRILNGTGNIIPSNNNTVRFSYNYNMPGVPDGEKENMMSHGQYGELFSYYSEIFSETSMNSNGNINFKIKILTTEPLATNESLAFFSFMQTMFSFRQWKYDNSKVIEKSKAICWVNNVHSNLVKRGVTNYSGNTSYYNLNENKDYQLISSESISGKKYDLLQDVTALLSGGTSQEARSFLYSLIPISEEHKGMIWNTKDMEFFLVNGSQYYKITSNDLQIKNNEPHTKDIKAMGTLNNLQTENSTVSTYTYLNYDTYVSNMNKQAFHGHNLNANYLTFLALNIKAVNTNSSVLTFQKILNEINDNSSKKTTYEFNTDNVDVSLFFLFGYHNKINSKTLPYDIYKANVKNFITTDKEGKQILSIPTDECYNFPHYTHKDENMILLNNSLLALPQTEPFITDQAGLSLSLIFFKHMNFLQNNCCANISMEYMPLMNDIQSPMKPMTNQLYLNISLLCEISDNIYCGFSSALMSQKYFLHKYIDTSWGFSFMWTKFTYILFFSLNYDMTHNTWAFTLKTEVTQPIYGVNPTYENEATTNYVEFL
jgi:hypothetical protein